MDAQTSKKRLGWKPIIAALLVIGIFGFFLTTEYGKSLFGSLGVNLGGEGLGGLGGLTGFISQPRPSGPGFQMTLTTTKENLAGQKYHVTNVSVVMSGIYDPLKVGDQSFASKSGKELFVSVADFTGDIAFTENGTMTLSGTTDYMEIGDLTSASSNRVKVQMEVIPTTASVSGLNLNTIHFDSITGSIQRFGGSVPDTVALSGGKLDITLFDGTLSWDDKGVTLSGIADSVKGYNFSFV